MEIQVWETDCGSETTAEPWSETALHNHSQGIRRDVRIIGPRFADTGLHDAIWHHTRYSKKKGFIADLALDKGSLS